MTATTHLSTVSSAPDSADADDGLPAHGTTARAKGRPRDNIKGCQCPRCRKAENAYNKRRQYAALTGQPYTVDAAPVAKHIAALIAVGATRHGIAKAARTSTNSVTNIVAGTQPTLHATTAERIMAVTAGSAIDDYHHRVDALFATRRIRALMAAGHPVVDIQNACDPAVVRTTMTQLINGTLTRIRARTDSAVKAAYQQLSSITGNSALSRNRAAREGWYTPQQWDDLIDDPTADPATWLRTGDVDVAGLVEDAEWLRKQTGDSWESIARQIGLPKDALHQYRTRVRRRAEQELAA